MSETLRKNAERGAKFLDGRKRGWHLAINTESLDMQYTNVCIIGQVFEIENCWDFEDTCDDLADCANSKKWAEDHGVALSYHIPGDRGENYEELREHWLAEIAKR